MFDALSDKLEGVFKKIRGEAQLSEDNIRDALREVRIALLDADVNFKVVKDFLKGVTEQAVGQETLKAVRPGEQVIKIVHDGMVAMMGGTTAEFALEPGGLQVITLLGLQGAGKTTFAGKLAHWCSAKGMKPMLVACDIYRPAAIEQLHVVGKGAGVPVFDMGVKSPVPEIAAKGIEAARAKGRDLVIIDTAGRLHIDEVKMDELTELKRVCSPKYTFLVADAMTGQDAVISAGAFNDGVGIDGVCLTKIDGDARGGAALSIRAVTQKPIYFTGTGEHLGDLEPFHPDRVASRILGMGDVLSLVEKAQQEFDEDEALEMQRKLKREEFSLEDFLGHLQKVKKMGSLKSIMGMIPGLGSAMRDMDVSDDDLKPTEAIIRSMTPAERADINLLNGQRRKRVAKGSGTTPADVNELLDQFKQMRKMMSQMMRMGNPGKLAMAGAAGGRGGPANMRNPNDAMAVKNKPKHRRKRKTKKNTKKQRRKR